jgi:glycosidase
MSMLYGSAPWPRFPAVYEINTRVWLNELSARAGRRITLENVPRDEIERLARLGFHAIWLMGVWTTGPQGVTIAREHPELQNEYRHALADFTPEDVIGSPYAVTKYEVAADVGGPSGLISFRGKLAAFGLRIVLDFVGNHTARDHRFAGERPEVYVRGTDEDAVREPLSFFKTAGGAVLAHGRDPYFPPWTDTAQVNYAQAAGRQAMKEELLSVAAQCDGIRCDMAMLSLPDVQERVWGNRLGPNPIYKSFWKEAIEEVAQRYPNCLMLAESYWDLEWRLQQEGFHFTYDRKLYERLRQSDFRGVRLHLQANPRFLSHCAHFIENHDEGRAVTVFGPARARSAALASFFTPGLRLVHEGQIEGWRVRTPVQLGRRRVESEDIETAFFYEKALEVLQDPIFQEGQFHPREVQAAGWGDSSHEPLLAMQWTPPASKSGGALRTFLVVVNMGGFHCYGRVPLPAEMFQKGKTYVFHDRCDGKRYEREGGELVWPGLYVALEAHQAHILELTAR